MECSSHWIKQLFTKDKMIHLMTFTDEKSIYGILLSCCHMASLCHNELSCLLAHATVCNNSSLSLWRQKPHYDWLPIHLWLCKYAAQCSLCCNWRYKKNCPILFLRVHTGMNTRIKVYLKMGPPFRSINFEQNILDWELESQSKDFENMIRLEFQTYISEIRYWMINRPRIENTICVFNRVSNLMKYVVRSLWSYFGTSNCILHRFLFSMFDILIYIYTVITKNIRYLLWNRGFWCSLNNTYPIFLTLCIRCTNHLWDSCDLTDVNPHFIPSLLRMIQNVDLLWRHRYKSRRPAIVTS